MSLSSDWENLNVTRDEVTRIGEALKQKEFRQMLIDYCEEIRDPENRKIYESEITQLEKERGINITFINPEPGYVIKTSSNGTTKTFVNVASSDKIDKPTSKSSTNEGQRGLVWTLPHTLAPPRRDVDNKGDVCHVYDVVFHPDTLHLAGRSNAFRQLVNDTAIDAVQQSFSVELDRTNIKFPKVAYKGLAKPTVIRKKVDGFDTSSLESSPIDSIYPPLKNISKATVVNESEAPLEKYTMPKYKVVQRRDIQFHEMTDELDAKVNLVIPQELVVTIDLPLLTTTQDANLDVTSKNISLTSEKPAKYKCEIALPYEVNEEEGNARFDKSKRQLIITLPVRSKRSIKIVDFLREDSGIESDQPPNLKIEQGDESDEASPVSETTPESKKSEKFLDDNIDYILPNCTFNQIQELLSFTLHVKNVDPTSIVITRKDLLNTAHIKFSSVGSGYFPVYYSFCVKFPSQQGGIFRDITAEAWDNNVIFQFELNQYDFESYEAGLNDDSLTSYDIAEKLIGRQGMTKQGKQIEDDSLCIGVEVSEKEDELVIEISGKKKKAQGGTSNDDEVSEDVFDEKKSIDSGRQTKKAMRKRAKKARSMSESYCDELKVINENELDNNKLTDESKNGRKKNKARSLSESSDEEHHHSESKVQNHHKYKSILKTRNSLSECHEMSSMDEHSKNFYSVSADDFGICESHDSLSESCKKQVRFSEIIKRQLFR
jgi:dynein assembly factor 2